MLLIYCMPYNHYRLNFSTASERQHPDDLTTPTVTKIIIMLPSLHSDVHKLLYVKSAYVLLSVASC